MPRFENIEITVIADMDFEVFCAECGEGLCGISDTRRSRTRGQAQVTVGNCPKCAEAIAEPLREKIEELENIILEINER